MTLAALLVIGILVGITTALFGFGGGFVTVPVIVVADAALGADAMHVATATSALVMLVNAGVATATANRDALRRLSGRWMLLALLGVGGALGAALSRFAPEPIIRWGFVAYLAATIIDSIARSGFLRPGSVASAAPVTLGLPTPLGIPIGGIAAFLGVGGSVMTVPLMRRAGAPMQLAATLANPLTLATIAPALAVSLVLRDGITTTAPGLVGSVDVVAAGALLLTSIPVIALLRRRPIRIADAIHARVYLALLVAAGAVVAVTG